MLRAIGVGVIFLATATGLAMSEQQLANRELPRVEWRFYSGDNGATKYSPLDQINKANVSTLKLAWRRPQVDADLLRIVAVPHETIARTWSLRKCGRYQSGKRRSLVLNGGTLVPDCFIGSTHKFPLKRHGRRKDYIFRATKHCKK